ncbi:MAG TPA: c-type cytochrome [Pyrinomonadaceae bacterium]|jgi:cbb3-type cytochrome c oxidase subunit III|nr:c-type cytochrome [Pyrinomonadaceae bacterium]
MKRIKGTVFLLGVVIVFGWVASATSAALMQPDNKKGARKSSAQTIEKGRAVYAANCARCHGGDGLGKTKLGEMVESPDLTDAKWQVKRSDARMSASVARGRGQMPGFAKKLSKEEIAAVVAYVRTMKK